MAIAASGHTYAHINNGVVQWIFTETQLPEWADGQITVADITGISPGPQPGWDAVETAGVWVFTPPQPLSLAQAQAAQNAQLYDAYAAASTAPVSFTTVGGVTKEFQADPASQNVLLQAFTGYNAAGAVPAGFYWRSADNTNVPFAFTDLKGLYAAMLAQGWAAFQHRVNQQTAVAAATTVAAVEAIIW